MKEFFVIIVISLILRIFSFYLTASFWDFGIRKAIFILSYYLMNRDTSFYARIFMFFHIYYTSL